MRFFPAVLIGLPLAAAGLTLTGCGQSAETTAENEAILRPAPPAGPSLDSLEAENKRLRDQVNALASENRTLSARVAELETRGAGLAQERATAQAPAASLPPERETAKAAPAAKDGDRLAGYNAALATFRARDFKEAIRQFEELLNRSIGANLADNCHYWIGESYYAMKKYDLAVQEFQNVLDFPSSDKANDAMLMMGSSYAAMGKTDEAKKVLGDLVKLSPDSGAARKAKAKLATMEK